MHTEILRYAYKPKLCRTAMACLFFVAIAGFMINHARSNNRGLIINCMLRLSAHDATVFYWCIAAMSATLVAAAVVMFVLGITGNRSVTLTAVDITAPIHGLSQRITTIRLTDVKRLNIQTVRDERFLNIHHSAGRLTIPRTLLPTSSAFEELCAAIANRVPRSARRSD